MIAIEIHNLKKRYREAKKETLHGITLSIPKGQFIGLLGPNGAGKTTTISCITGVTSPTEGNVRVFGHDVIQEYREARACIGVSPQDFTIDIFQSVDEILDYQAGAFGIIGQTMLTRRDELLTVFDLMTHRHKKFQFLSGGLKRRVMLAKAMMHNPKILILDEPTAGVDVETRKVLWNFLKKLHSEGKTIILTSHYLEEVEELCERVVIIKDGTVIADDTIDNFTKDTKLENVYLSLVETETN
ncbi:MAG: hypothetical protein RLZZ308_737 [Candidatus Parcubacteria bacterium]|jgi:ABC-2 type transport system ATP-binding protein